MKDSNFMKFFKLKMVFVLYGFLFIVAMYLVAAKTAYRFRHPEKTETQIMIDFVDVITWK